MSAQINIFANYIKYVNKNKHLDLAFCIKKILLPVPGTIPTFSFVRQTSIEATTLSHFAHKTCGLSVSDEISVGQFSFRPEIYEIY